MMQTIKILNYIECKQLEITVKKNRGKDPTYTSTKVQKDSKILCYKLIKFMNTPAFNFVTTCQVIQSTCQIFFFNLSIIPF